MYLYGMKEAGLQWMRELDRFLGQNGFEASRKDIQIYRKGKVTLGVHVDDGLLTGPRHEIMDVIALLEGKWTISHGEARKYVGWNIHQDIKGKTIFISQRDYAEVMLQEWSGEVLKEWKIPMDPTFCAIKNSGDTDTKRVNDYGRLVGQLMHMTQTRPDIQLAVNTLAGHIAQPAEKHMEAAVRVLGYVMGTVDWGILLGGKGTKEAELLTGYVDSSFAEEPGRKSRTGGLIFYRGSLIHSCSLRQRIVAHSSAEAEYIALDELAMTVVYIRQLLETLGIKVDSPTCIFEDNQSAIIMAEGTGMQNRTKHIELRYYAIRGYIADGKIELKYLGTDEMIADTLTKALARVKFEKFRELMGMIALGGSAVSEKTRDGRCAIAIMCK
jgi:hypothetical protein